MYISPIVYNHTLDGPAFSSPAAWYVTQWDGTQEMNASGAIAGAGPCPTTEQWTPMWHLQAAGALVCMLFSECSADGAASGDGRPACVGSGLHTVLVRGDGAAAALPCGAEYDLFVSPNDAAYSNAPVNIEPVGLAAVSGLNASFTLQLDEFSTTPRCGPAGSCGPSGQLDYGYVTLGVVLSNLAAGQTVFYQVRVFLPLMITC